MARQRRSLKNTHQNIPACRPNPPRLSAHSCELTEIEESGIFSNFGPVNQRFERELVETMFGTGQCLTVCNATTGLIIAIRQVLGEDPPRQRRYALMPSFTFAATAHAAMWNGLTPLLCDVDSETWVPSAAAEEALLEQYASEIAVIVPYATFGNNLDLRRYDKLSERYRVPVVVDAATSLGSLDDQGRAFGSGFRWPVVFSMHATKTFSTGEGGVVYCADKERLHELRAMCSFGFESSRVATLPGLNAKLTEVAALTALLQLRRLQNVLEHREILSLAYKQHLPTWTRQKRCGKRQSLAFEPVLLPESLASRRRELLEMLEKRGVGASTYFSPHVAEQPYFAKRVLRGPLPVTESLAACILILPLFDAMTERDVHYVTSTLLSVAAELDGPQLEPLLTVGHMRRNSNGRAVKEEQGHTGERSSSISDGNKAHEYVIFQDAN